jgi:hypothetical protein
LKGARALGLRSRLRGNARAMEFGDALVEVGLAHNSKVDTDFFSEDRLEKAHDAGLSS